MKDRTGIRIGGIGLGRIGPAPRLGRKAAAPAADARRCRDVPDVQPVRPSHRGDGRL